MNAHFETFKTRAEAVSAEVHRFATRPEALAFLFGFLGEQGGTALWAAGAFLSEAERDAARRQAPGLSFQVERAAAATAAVGISEMDWAAANTGTLVQDAAAVEQRLVSTLPPIHVALIGTARIQPDMGAVLGRIHPGRTNYIAMISGPSRTADIERVLTIGVHGPARLVIVAVDEFQQEEVA
jgi:L-lactate dehydrogenase complex protein LldG